MKPSFSKIYKIQYIFTKLLYYSHLEDCTDLCENQCHTELMFNNNIITYVAFVIH